MQQIEDFLQEKISFRDLDVDHLVELTLQHQNPHSHEYTLLELTLNQLLSKYLEVAKTYVEKL